ncbi:pyrroline-5-carboxylate reductase [Acidovorax sp. Be4]|uniref:Pyrroline-5-carboxylate reductase n=1 Tax=Acidovorax bellezanensis TaxID=2976702 RepID=A0ABT2PL88_9BURK|nr:pyrroline-5-carboxylate reductase [Acidovorax sp. Be4]MCT9811245.1 pyrroline-5-carboxylate reductase [Acidovorax sp. Be4]
MSAPLTAKSHPRLAFIGGGQMASAMVAGLLRAGQDPASILVVEPTPAQRAHLEQTLQVSTAACADARLSAADVVVWAVKPQVLRQAADAARAHLGAALHVSIAAGLSLQTLSDWLHSQRVVRAMPNTAALVGAGVTGMAAAEGVSAADRQLAASVLAATGHCFWVDSDERIDAVTAVSGSGPAYVFHFLEAFQAAAQTLGFDTEAARELVLRTAAGAVAQAQLGEPFGMLRARVTSPQGTTAAALNCLDAQGTPQAMQAAVRAAYERAAALSLELSGQTA